MFHPLEKLHLLHEGYKQTFKVGRLNLLLIQSEGNTFLVENRCPHMDAPLNFGTVQEGIIRCPLHGIRFDLQTGQGHAPGCSRLRTYTPAYEGNLIGIVIDSES